MPQPQFEGIIYVWPQNRYEERLKIIFRIDHAALMLYTDHDRGHAQIYIPDLIERLKPKLRSADGAMAALFAQEHTPDERGARVLRDIVGDGLKNLSGFPGFKQIAPGVSAMRSARRCDKAELDPVAGVDVDFSGTDLSGVYFTDTDFSRAKFSPATRFNQAKLERCSFSDSQLAGLNFNGAEIVSSVWQDKNMAEIGFEGATLREVTLMRCTLTKARFGGAKFDKVVLAQCTARKASFDGATGNLLGFGAGDLSEATFVGANIDNTGFFGVDLRKTTFKDARLSGAQFCSLGEGLPGPLLDETDFDNTDLSGANFSGMTLTGKVRHARPPRLGKSVDARTRLVGATFHSSFLSNDWSYIDAAGATIVMNTTLPTDKFKAVHAILPTMELAGLTLRDADFSNAQLKRARFGNGNLSDALFNGAMLDGADFTSAELQGASFNNANLASVNFTQAWLWGAHFQETVLADTNFSSAMLAEVGFSKIKNRSLAGVNFSRACLAQADFQEVVSTVSGTKVTSFSEACLAGTDFTGAKLPDAELTNAQVSTAKGTIKVIHPRRSKTFTYEATRLTPGSTGKDTTCPDGGFGPCSVERLRVKPVAAEWKP